MHGIDLRNFVTKEPIVDKYCDTKILENNWFQWIISSETPGLEKYRKKKLLWTKIVGKVKTNDGEIFKIKGETFNDPYHSRRIHCILLDRPIIIFTDNGIITKSFFLDDMSTVDLESIDCSKRMNDVNFENNLKSNGYILEKKNEDNWSNILLDINRICDGIARKFNQPTEEEHAELIHDALIQVMRKLTLKKIIYIPGKAPVFNLLTTTIFRIMYSIMNRRTSQKRSAQKLIEEARNSTLPENIRSFRTCSNKQN